MYYNERKAALTGKEIHLRYALDTLMIDLQQAWRAYSKRGEGEQQWMYLLAEYNKLAENYREVLKDLSLTEEASLSDQG